MTYSIDEFDAILFDCDGVLTNNFVYQDENGKESVRFNRSDGLAFNALKKLGKPTYIISTEVNPVVTKRANKLEIVAIQGVRDKTQAVKDLAIEHNYDLNKILYVGNDINDYDVMTNVGLSACPSDSHEEVKSISSINLNSKGGEGIVRELLEKVFELNLRKILF
tara:strand:- start:58 stop:552 length:495 start_codon:yes stop_codon:yes gene_type:complete